MVVVYHFIKNQKRGNVMKKIRNGKWIVSLGAAIMFLFSFIFSTGGGYIWRNGKRRTSL